MNQSQTPAIPVSIDKLLQTIGMLFVQGQMQIEKIQALEAELKAKNAK